MYAHTYDDQEIDTIKKKYYENIFNYYNFDYNDLLCKKCKNMQCIGGYNCKYGTFDTDLQLCKNYLLTGECIYQIYNIKRKDKIKKKKLIPIFKYCKINNCEKEENKLDKWFSLKNI